MTHSRKESWRCLLSFLLHQRVDFFPLPWIGVALELLDKWKRWTLYGRTFSSYLTLMGSFRFLPPGTQPPCYGNPKPRGKTTWKKGEALQSTAPAKIPARSSCQPYESAFLHIPVPGGSGNYSSHQQDRQLENHLWAKSAYSIMRDKKMVVL